MWTELMWTEMWHKSSGGDVALCNQLTNHFKAFWFFWVFLLELQFEWDSNVWQQVTHKSCSIGLRLGLDLKRLKRVLQNRGISSFLFLFIFVKTWHPHYLQSDSATDASDHRRCDKWASGSEKWSLKPSLSLMAKRGRRHGLPKDIRLYVSLWENAL